MCWQHVLLKTTTSRGRHHSRVKPKGRSQRYTTYYSIISIPIFSWLTKDSIFVHCPPFVLIPLIHCSFALIRQHSYSLGCLRKMQSCQTFVLWTTRGEEQRRITSSCWLRGSCMQDTWRTQCAQVPGHTGQSTLLVELLCFPHLQDRSFFNIHQFIVPKLNYSICPQKRVNKIMKSVALKSLIEAVCILLVTSAS